MKKFIKSKEMSITIILLMLCLMLTLMSPVFFTAENFLDIIRSSAVIGILALGMTLVIITGGIDVSVAAVTSAVCVVLGQVLIRIPDNAFALVGLLILGPVVGIILGALNGLLVSKIKIPAIVVTLGSLNIISGVILFTTNGKYLNSTNFPSVFMNFAMYKFLSIPIVVWIFIAMTILTWWILEHTLIGREVLATGGNEESAYRVGISYTKVQLFVFSYMGFCAGVAAIVQTAYTKAVDPNGLAGLEMTVIAAVVLGGANILGGRGKIYGTIVGVLLLAVIENGLILAKIDTFWQKVITGLIILIAVSFDQIQDKRKKSKLATIEVEQEGGRNLEKNTLFP